jgi:hypothetical protein
MKKRKDVEKRQRAASFEKFVEQVPRALIPELFPVMLESSCNSFRCC